MWGALVFEFGLFAVIVGSILAFALAVFILYLFLRIFMDSDKAWDVACMILLTPVAVGVGCLFPGILLGLLTLCFFESFVAGIVIGGLCGLGFIIKSAIDN